MVRISACRLVECKRRLSFTLINGKEVTEEIRKNSDVQSLRLEGNVYGHFGRGGKLNGKVYYYDSERGLPGSVILYNSNARERVWDNDFLHSFIMRTNGLIA